MTRKRHVFLSILLSVSNIAVAAEAPRNNPKSLADTALKQCTPKAALGWLDVESIEREGDNAAQDLKVANKLKALVEEMPPSKKDIPIGQQMTPEQTGRFVELSSQMLIYRYSHLAESRLQRDVRVIDWAIDAMEKLQADSTVREFKTKDDPGADGIGLLGLLRATAEGERLDDIEAAKTSVCSLDMAMYRMQQRAYAAVQRLLASKDAAEWNELRAKYKIAGPIDASRLPSPDREKALWLQKAVAEPARRDLQALQDWRNLRRFATVSALKYSTERDAIITGAGSKDFDYGANFSKAYKRADQVMQQTMNAWNVIDENIPSEASKENAEMLKISKGAQAGKN